MEKVKTITIGMLLLIYLVSCSGDDDSIGNNVYIQTFEYSTDKGKGLKTVSRGDKVLLEARTSSSANASYTIMMFIEPENQKTSKNWNFNKNYYSQSYIKEEINIPENVPSGAYKIGIVIQEIKGENSENFLSQIDNLPSFARRIKNIEIR
ncbi:DUF4625 domain-containing protein [Sinomicrobium pectinilyticum]|uniref:DUF4625 domain-containing protein n=1 Tax=Sinomicrobium pectinilyticum TaxID=1084421 RepID=A0A3N0EVB6_SINP1|nr:DUF4625 domain-containing protein [Sinomicrobium pectinilyticum]RNL91702.1 DUF4625 domain-containing protein [Sinomicrobium pectinilyticum]